MEKRKRGRPKVDTHLTEGYYDNRRQELNYKYMFEGTGVLMDAADEIPERTILYEMDKENRCFKACKTGILEQLGRMRKRARELQKLSTEEFVGTRRYGFSVSQSPSFLQY